MTVLALAIDVLDDHDRVIDDHADGEQEAHHRRHVERPAHEEEDDDGAEQRERESRG